MPPGKRWSGENPGHWQTGGNQPSGNFTKTRRFPGCGTLVLKSEKSQANGVIFITLSFLPHINNLHAVSCCLSLLLTLSFHLQLSSTPKSSPHSCNENLSDEASVLSASERTITLKGSSNKTQILGGKCYKNG